MFRANHTNFQFIQDWITVKVLQGVANIGLNIITSILHCYNVTEFLTSTHNSLLQQQKKRLKNVFGKLDPSTL